MADFECEQYQILISRRLDGELTADEREALQAHLSSCPDCARLYAAFSAVSDTLRSDLEEPPSALRENVMGAVRAKKGDIVRLRRRRVRLTALAACLALLVLGSAGLGLFSRSGGMTAASTSAAYGKSTSGGDTETAADAAGNNLMTTGGAESANGPEFTAKSGPDTAAPAVTSGPDTAAPAVVSGPDTATPAVISGPDGSCRTADADTTARLDDLLAYAGDAAAPSDTAGAYTVSLPDRGTLTVVPDGDKLLCQSDSADSWYLAAGSAADLQSLLQELDSVN